MISWFKHLDDLLRGRKTSPDRLAEGKVELSLRMFVPLVIVLGLTYGFFMGWYAIFSRDPASYEQWLASTVKLPLLFLLTLLVTFPSLYVFNALVGCRLSFAATLRLLVGAIAVNVAVAASLGPILGFFTFSTTGNNSYPFMILLNVVLLAIGGFVGLAFLLHTLRRLAWTPASRRYPPPSDLDGTNLPGELAKRRQSSEDSPNAADPSGSESSPNGVGPLDHVYDDVPEQALGTARGIFQIWVIIYGLVGAQMGWLLRPFIGSPNMDFQWFRPRSGNFFQAVFQHIQNLFGG
jgi:hypothetical protein